jgi:hypothetical protein
MSVFVIFRESLLHHPGRDRYLIGRHACELIRGMQRPSENLAIGHEALEPVLSCLIRSSSSQR